MQQAINGVVFFILIMTTVGSFLILVIALLCNLIDESWTDFSRGIFIGILIGWGLLIAPTMMYMMIYNGLVPR